MYTISHQGPHHIVQYMFHTELTLQRTEHMFHRELTLQRTEHMFQQATINSNRFYKEK